MYERYAIQAEKQRVQEELKRRELLKERSERNFTRFEEIRKHASQVDIERRERTALNMNYEDPYEQPIGPYNSRNNNPVSSSQASRVG